MLELLEAQPFVSRSFDYGTGKGRYIEAIASKCGELYVADSKIQLGRKQRLFGNITSLAEHFASTNAVTTISTKEFLQLRDCQRGHCINVLSAVPLPAVRRAIVDRCYRATATGGHCLFVVQYRNSDFTRMASLPAARAFRDGFLIQSLRGWSFYGLIGASALAKMVECAGFANIETSLNEGSAYVWGRK